MCDELKGELEKAEANQIALAEHLIYMNADKCTGTVEVEGRSFQITIERLPHPSDFTTSL